jgi:hypothetical protein
MLEHIDLCRAGAERCLVLLFDGELAELPEVVRLAERLFPGFGYPFCSRDFTERLFGRVGVVPEIVSRGDLLQLLYARIMRFDVKDTSADCRFVPRDR